MRTFDLSPLYRSTVGFDRLFSMLDNSAAFEGGGSPYPPYNIERTGENAYRVTIAVAGFADSELSIETKENTLTVKGEKRSKPDGERSARCSIRALRHAPSSGYSGLPTSWRSRRAALENGLLHVDLVREIPEAMKPRTIPIGNGNAVAKTVDRSKLRKRSSSASSEWC